jgi:hypothetical protein
MLNRMHGPGWFFCDVMAVLVLDMSMSAACCCVLGPLLLFRLHLVGNEHVSGVAAAYLSFFCFAGICVGKEHVSGVAAAYLNCMCSFVCIWLEMSMSAALLLRTWTACVVLLAFVLEMSMSVAMLLRTCIACVILPAFAADMSMSAAMLLCTCMACVVLPAFESDVSISAAMLLRTCMGELVKRVTLVTQGAMLLRTCMGTGEACNFVTQGLYTIFV